MDAIHDAADYVGEHLGQPAAAYLAGSATTEHRTPTSDLDIVVVHTGSVQPYRETVRFRGWLVEVFTHTRTSLEHYWAQDAAELRPVLIRMVAEGDILVSEDGLAEELQQRAQAILEAGPRRLSGAEIDARRYQLTALLDDLEGAGEAGEVAFIAAVVLQKVSELALLMHGRWLGTDKWLFRHVHSLDPEGTQALISAHRAAVCDRDKGPLLRVVQQFLDQAGGRLQEGYRSTGVNPDARCEDHE